MNRAKELARRLKDQFGQFENLKPDLRELLYLIDAAEEQKIWRGPQSKCICHERHEEPCSHCQTGTILFFPDQQPTLKECVNAAVEHMADEPMCAYCRKLAEDLKAAYDRERDGGCQCKPKA